MLIVQKYGGTSVGDAARVRAAAGRIAETYLLGHDVVAVLSAQGDTTDELLSLAAELNPSPPKRELDMLLATGEQRSVALMAICLARMGIPAVSLTGRQAGVRTDAAHGDARIRRVDTSRIRRELGRRRVVLVAGFQGADDADDVTTLGRGGSDTTAVALAAALGAARCQIFTDVDGVYTSDPRRDPAAKKYASISFDDMLALCHGGAQVLMDRSVELARRTGTRIEVLSALRRAPGTTVG